MNNAKVCIIIGSLDRGGTEVHLLRVLPRLAQQGLLVEIFTLSHPGTLAAAMAQNGVPVRTPWWQTRNRWCRLPRFLLTLIQLLGYLWAQPRHSIVHFFLPMSYLVGTPLALLVGPRLRVMSRRSLNLYQQRSPLARHLEPWLHQRMHAILANSSAIVRELKAEGAPRVGLIVNGIPLPKGTGTTGEPLRAQLGIAEPTLLLCTLANLIPYKGHMDIIQALAIEPPQGQDWCMVFAGRDDGHASALRAAIQDHKLAQHIRFVGPLEDGSALLEAADIYVHAAHEEGSPNAVIEAMLAGLGIVATDVGGTAEALGETGILVPSHDPKALASAIHQLAEDPALRQRLGKRARMRARERFPLEACVGAYRQLYDTLWAGRDVVSLPFFQSTP